MNRQIASCRQILDDCKMVLEGSQEDKTSAMINLMRLKESISVAQSCGHNIQALRFNSTEAIAFYCACYERETSIEKVKNSDLNQMKRRQKKRSRKMDKDRGESMEAHGGSLQHNPLEDVADVVETHTDSGSVEEVIDASAGDPSSNDSGPDRDVASTSGNDEQPFVVRLSLRTLKEAIEEALACNHDIQKLRNGGLGFYCVLCDRETAIFGAY